MSIFVDIEKRVGDFHLNISFSGENGILSLLGTSGSGKSMTLKCIAGIEKPDRGRIVLDGVTLFDSEKKINLPPQKRSVGLLFQTYALFPNMTVLKNLKVGCRNPKSRHPAEIQEFARIFELESLLDRYPHQLSGGQQQRVAIARILLSRPKVLLLDEPFSALDAHLRFRLEREMLDVLHKFGGPVLLVSHDRDEVYRMSDQIAIMERGRISVQGSRDEVFRSPRTPDAATLTGCKNVAPCTLLDEHRLSVPRWGMTLEYPKTDHPVTHVGIRMHSISPGKTENAILCQVTSVLENPFSYVIMLRPVDAPEAEPIGWETDKTTWDALRCDQLWVSFPREKLLCLEEQ